MSTVLPGVLAWGVDKHATLEADRCREIADVDPEFDNHHVVPAIGRGHLLSRATS